MQERVSSRIPKAPAPIGALATDGWRKKTAEQGVPLINSELLLPNGGSIFQTVRVSHRPCRACHAAHMPCSRPFLGTGHAAPLSCGCCSGHMPCRAAGMQPCAMQGLPLLGACHALQPD